MKLVLFTCYIQSRNLTYLCNLAARQRPDIPTIYKPISAAQAHNIPHFSGVSSLPTVLPTVAVNLVERRKGGREEEEWFAEYWMMNDKSRLSKGIELLDY
jgi:hypothetical protein